MRCGYGQRPANGAAIAGLAEELCADRLLREVERLGGAGALVDQADGQVGLESAGGIVGGP